MGEIGIWLLENGGILVIICIIFILLCVTLIDNNTSSGEQDKTSNALDEYRKILRKRNTTYAEEKVLTETDKIFTAHE